MIRALIFDLGKVVFDVSFERCFEYWSGITGQSVHDIRSRFSFDGAYTDFETASITQQEFRKRLSDELQFSVSDMEFDEGWCSLYMDVFPEVESLLRELKGKYGMVALTNTNEIHEHVWKVKYAGVLDNFQTVFSSHDLRMRKPDPQIFSYLLEQMKCNPDEVIFIDDNPENCVAASKLGIHSILAITPDQFIGEIRSVLHLTSNLS